jgi:hypothetical protein
MADTIRETILAHYKTLLENYSGWTFLTSPSPNVVRGVEYIQTSIYPLPCISILAKNEESEPSEGYFHQVNHVPLEFWCVAEFDVEQPSETAEALIGDLIKAVLSSDESDAESVFYSGSAILYPDTPEATTLEVSVVFDVTYRTDIGDPYTYTG